MRHDQLSNKSTIDQFTWTAIAAILGLGVILTWYLLVWKLRERRAPL